MSADIQRAMRVLLFCEKMWSVKIIRYEYNLKFGHDSQLVRALVSLSALLQSTCTYVVNC